MGYAGNEGTAWESIFKVESTGGIIVRALGMLLAAFVSYE